MDSPMVMRAALELFHNRNYPSVVAVCEAALDEDPGDLPMRLLLSRALLALRRDAEAQEGLSEALRREPRCAEAYRLLAQMAMRRDELKSAEIFAREAMRLDPDNNDTRELLELILRFCRPTATVEKLPAATVAVGRPFPGTPSSNASTSVARPPMRPGRRVALGTQGGMVSGTLPGTHAPPPQPTARGTEAGPAPRRRSRGSRGGRTMRFGEYLVSIGCLSPSQLRAAIAYHRSRRIRIGAAAAALGFVSEPKLEWAAQAFHASR